MQNCKAIIRNSFFLMPGTSAKIQSNSYTFFNQNYTLKLSITFKMATLVGFAKEEIFKVYFTTLKNAKILFCCLGPVQKVQNNTKYFSTKITF